VDDIRVPSARTDLSISLTVANIISIVMMPAILLLVLVPYGLIWGTPSVPNGDGDLSSLLVLILVFAASIVAHEALHGVEFVRFGRLPWSAVHFGFKWKALMPYAHCASAMTASAYRWSFLLPGAVLGLAPALLGIGWLAVYGTVMLVAASGDLIALWLIRKVASDAQVIDHSERVGCWVLTE